MPRKTYEHSAYYYAYHNGWTYSEARTYAGRYLDMHTYRPRMRRRPDGEWDTKDWFKWRNSSKKFDSTFDPMLLLAMAAVDIGIAMRDTVCSIANPDERALKKEELMRDLRRVRRPFYYEQEVARRRELAKERRKIRRRSTTAPMPTPKDILAAWNERKTSRAAMILLGGMLHDLECYVDNCLKFDDVDNVIGRNGGIRGWLADNLPELLPKYKTLMRYKALAIRLRQATGTKDPKPTSKLLVKPFHKAVAKIIAEEAPVFARVFAMTEQILASSVITELPDDVIQGVFEQRSVKRRRIKT